VNVDKFRRSLRAKWLEYYRDNRDWLVRLGVWVTCQGQRRPSSSFILATLSILEPKLTQLLPLVVDLSQSPDRIVIALGLNFNPEEALEKTLETAIAPSPETPKQLPSSDLVEVRMPNHIASVSSQAIAQRDEDCSGAVRSIP
jgi:Family of unknown function (DUF5331)